MFVHKPFWMDVAHIVGIVLLAMLLTRFTIYNISSLSIFAPLDKEIDFQMSDLYNAVADNKAIHPFSQDVVIVGTDGCSRKEVLDIINKVSDCQPKAIGLDIYFTYPEEDNTYLIQTILGTPNLVGTEFAEQDVDGVHFHQKYMSFYDSELRPLSGYINLNISNPQQVVRTFRPFVKSIDGDTLYSMPYVLAKLANPNKVNKLISQNQDEVIIDYTTCDIMILTADELEDSYARESIYNKVVLIGDVQDLSDAHLTPVHGLKAGVMIHAYALQTILGEQYIDTTKSWFNWFIAILLCVIYVSLLLFSKRCMINYGSLVLRIGQFLVIYLLIYIGCSVYQSSHFYIDFAPGVLMLGLGSLAFDLWFGAYALIVIINNKIHKK